MGLRLSDGVILRQYRNVAKAETWGAEIAASYWLTQEWELATKLGWVDGEDSQGEALRTLTPLEGNTRLSYQTHDWSLGVQADYAAAMDRVPSCGNSLTKRQDACLTSAGWFSLAMTADWLITDALKVNFKLDNLTLIIDHNKLQLGGTTEDVMNIVPIDAKFRDFHWHTITINGYDFTQIKSALQEALAHKGQPTVIIAETVKGKGVDFMENNKEWHNKALDAKDAATALKELGGEG